MSTLDVIATFPAGSELALDLFTPARIRHTAAMDGILQALAKIGEPFKSSYEPDAFKARLTHRGFGRIDMVNIEGWLLRQGAQFGGRFAANPGPSLLVTAQVSSTAAAL